jgi:hypothetical protein
LPSRLTAGVCSKAPGWPASRLFGATCGSSATVRRSTYRRGSTVRRRQPASIGSMPNVASNCESWGSARTTAMIAGGGLFGRGTPASSAD